MQIHLLTSVAVLVNSTYTSACMSDCGSSRSKELAEVVFLSNKTLFIVVAKYKGESVLANPSVFLQLHNFFLPTPSPL